MDANFSSTATLAGYFGRRQRPEICGHVSILGWTGNGDDGEWAKQTIAPPLDKHSFSLPRLSESWQPTEENVHRVNPHNGGWLVTLFAPYSLMGENVLALAFQGQEISQFMKGIIKMFISVNMHS